MITAKAARIIIVLALGLVWLGPSPAWSEAAPPPEEGPRVVIAGSASW